MNWLTPAEVAARKGCGKSTVTLNMRKGVLPSKRGKVSQADADAWTPRRTRPPKRDSEPESLAPATTPPAGAAKPEPDDGPTPSPFQLASQRLKQIELERAERKWQQEQGLVVEREQVVNLLVDFAARLRSEMQSYPRRMQAELVRKLKCKRCGGEVDGKHVAIVAERFADDFLRLVAKSPLGEAKVS